MPTAGPLTIRMTAVTCHTTGSQGVCAIHPRHFGLTPPRGHEGGREWAEMADRAKRQRMTTLRPAPPPEPLVAPKEPPQRLIGRSCRVRLVHVNDAWLSGTLLSCSGPHKQTCELELDAADAAAPRRVEKVHLSTQPVHVLDEVVWGPEQGPASAESKAAAAAGGGRGDEAKGGSMGAYVVGLVPMLLFTPLGPPELEADDGQVLAQSLDSGEHVWVRREATRALSVHMLRRRTIEKYKGAVTAALEQERALLKSAAKTAKKGIVGKRIAVYWPMDDAWYSGVIAAWDNKASQHRVLYDDGCARARREPPSARARAPADDSS